ncbi:MAG TPA: class I SAM-dependent methyltransferase [Thermodesulfovibrionales bacterium]|nr:class I SAM-dependent methyltransferase [Thermodesulfovibrionales bacterium]
MSECVLCNGVLEDKILEGINNGDKIYEVFFCRRCKTGSTVPVPTSAELSRLYGAGSYRASGGKRFNPVIEFFILLSRHLRRKRIERYIGQGRMLDIGCGRGLFLDVMRRRGWEVTGVEFDKEVALRAAETYNIKVISGGPAEWGLPAESFDVITLSHVLEHVYDPAEMIRECSKIIRKGGLVVVALPNMGSLQASVGKAGWFHLDVPYHLHHFTEEGLTGLLHKNCLRKVKVRHFDLEYNFFGWLQTLLNISGTSMNFLYEVLKSAEVRKKKLAESKKRDLLLTLALLPFYLPLSFLLSFFESFVLKRGGTIEVYAVREQPHKGGCAE